jgi:hypothetical protein
LKTKCAGRLTAVVVVVVVVVVKLISLSGSTVVDDMSGLLAIEALAIVSELRFLIVGESLELSSASVVVAVVLPLLTSIVSIGLEYSCVLPFGKLFDFIPVGFGTVLDIGFHGIAKFGVHRIEKSLNFDRVGNRLSESGSGLFHANCRGGDSIDSSISDLIYLIPIVPISIDFRGWYDMLSEVGQDLFEVERRIG